MQKEVYPFQDKAFAHIGYLITQAGFKIKQVTSEHKGRHRLFVTDNLNFYCLFRKEDTEYACFKKFNEYFEHFILENPDLSGHAETINKEVIESICIPKYDLNSEDFEKEIVLIYTYEEGRAYICNPFLFKKFAEKHNLIRQRKALDPQKINGEIIGVQETVYHLPFKNMFFINLNNWLSDNASRYIFK